MAPEPAAKERLASRRHARAYLRARSALAQRYPDEFRDILEAEKAREGIRTLQPRQVVAHDAA